MPKNKKTKSEQNEDVTYKIKDLSIKDITPNVIDNYLVVILDEHQTIVIPSTTTGMQFKAWRRTRGGIFAKDVLNYALNKPCGKYVLIKGKDMRCIARLITEEENMIFSTLRLIDGQIKDMPYMILKNLKENEKLTSTRKYIEEKDVIS